ncbi:MAG: histidinol-phosphate transaminase [Acidimicrobiales bacterium]
MTSAFPTSRWLRPELHGVPSYGSAVVSPAGYEGPTHKLSSNESPYPPSEAVIEAMQGAARASNRYPDMFADDMAGVLAEHYALPADRVAVAGGSLVLLQQAVQAVASPGDEVLFGWRSYEAYPIIAEVARCTSVRAPLHQHRLDLDQLAQRVSDATRIVIVCSPNNPTSTDISSRELEGFLEALPPSCLVILDQAYREFATSETVPDGLHLQERFDQLLVLRTFSKAHSLAGARIGWCVGDPEILQALRRVALPFTLSRVAAAAAMAALAEDAGSVSGRLAAIIGERNRVAARLRQFGFEVPASEANFLWLPLADKADSFAYECARVGISVRCFSGEGVRVTIGTVTANDLVIEAAQSFISKR